jgi:hypothetical protein
VIYALATAAIVVDLTDLSNNQGFAEGDTYTSIEAITGSTHNDTFIGDAFVFKLNGGNGDDDITTGTRVNNIHLGSGNNIVRFVDGTGYDRIRSFDANDDTFDVTAWGATSFGQITFSDQSGYTEMSYDDETIRVDGVAEADFTADNFLF